MTDSIWTPDGSISRDMCVLPPSDCFVKSLIYSACELNVYMWIAGYLYRTLSVILILFIILKDGYYYITQVSLFQSVDHKPRFLILKYLQEFYGIIHNYSWYKLSSFTVLYTSYCHYNYWQTVLPAFRLENTSDTVHCYTIIIW